MNKKNYKKMLITLANEISAMKSEIMSCFKRDAKSTDVLQGMASSENAIEQRA